MSDFQNTLELMRRQLRPCPRCGQDFTELVFGMAQACRGANVYCSVCHFAPKRDWVEYGGDARPAAVARWNSLQREDPSCYGPFERREPISAWRKRMETRVADCIVHALKEWKP